MIAEIPESQGERRIGKIEPANELLAFERVVLLPMDLAILFSAIQNFRLDLAKGYYHSVSQWKNCAHAYYAEAKELLIEEGCNHFPGDNGEPWIHAVGVYGKFNFPTQRVEHLAQCLDVIFKRGDANLMESEIFPTLKNCASNDAISKLVSNVHLRLTVH